MSGSARSTADITGTWHCCGAGGAAAQDFVITSGKGALAGEARLPGGTVFATITGSMSGAPVTIITTYKERPRPTPSVARATALAVRSPV